MTSNKDLRKPLLRIYLERIFEKDLLGFKTENIIDFDEAFKSYNPDETDTVQTYWDQYIIVEETKYRTPIDDVIIKATWKQQESRNKRPQITAIPTFGTFDLLGWVLKIHHQPVDARTYSWKQEGIRWEYYNRFTTYQLQLTGELHQATLDRYNKSKVVYTEKELKDVVQSLLTVKFPDYLDGSFSG